MRFIELKTNRPFVYNFTGKFEAPSPSWKHSDDYPLMNYELIVVTADTLYLTYADRNYTVPPKSFLLLPPLPPPYNLRRGFRSSACNFYWLHFETDCPPCLKNVLKEELTGYMASLPDDTISLPIQGSLPNYARIIILMKQLQDAVRSQYSSHFLDYLTTIILYEVYYELNPILPPPDTKCG